MSASASNNNGVYLVFATTSGAITLVAVKEASGVAIDRSTNAVTLTPTNLITAVFLNVAGKATVES